MPEDKPVFVYAEAYGDPQRTLLLEELAHAKAQLAASQGEMKGLRDAARAAVEREQLLADELQHRIRNMLAILRSIYRRSFENGASQDQFAEHFGGRLEAIARYQADIADVRSSGVDLEILIREELLSVQFQEGPRCAISGPPVRLRQKCAELIGLAIHELTTNAVKFGALSTKGTISVEWSLKGTHTAPILHLHWKEAGVALLWGTSRPQGFGQDLIERAIPYQLGATTAFEFKPGGLHCSIILPLPPSTTLLLGK